jgi:hypothetical protein
MIFYFLFIYFFFFFFKVELVREIKLNFLGFVLIFNGCLDLGLDF